MCPPYGALEEFKNVILNSEVKADADPLIHCSIQVNCLLCRYEQAFITAQLAKDEFRFYTDLHDKIMQGNFMYTDNTTATYSHWMTGYPSKISLIINYVAN